MGPSSTNPQVKIPTLISPFVGEIRIGASAPELGSVPLSCLPNLIWNGDLQDLSLSIWWDTEPPV
jgi:hypothetical protein